MTKGRKFLRTLFKTLIFGGAAFTGWGFLNSLGNIGGPFNPTGDKIILWSVAAIEVGVILYAIEFLFSWRERMAKKGIEKLIEVSKILLIIAAPLAGALVISSLLKELTQNYQWWTGHLFW